MTFYFILIGAVGVLFDVSAAEIVTAQALVAIAHGFIISIRECLAVYRAMREDGR